MVKPKGAVEKIIRNEVNKLEAQAFLNNALLELTMKTKSKVTDPAKIKKLDEKIENLKQQLAFSMEYIDTITKKLNA